jgi:hypothetical protein
MTENATAAVEVRAAEMVMLSQVLYPSYPSTALHTGTSEASSEKEVR